MFSDLHTVGNDPYWIQLDHAWRARLDLHLVLANGKVLLGLVMTRSSCAGNGAIKSVLVVTWCRCWVMLVMMLLSCANNGATESVLAVTWCCHWVMLVTMLPNRCWPCCDAVAVSCWWWRYQFATDSFDVNQDGRAWVQSWPPPNWSWGSSHHSLGCSRQVSRCHHQPLGRCHRPFGCRRHSSRCRWSSGCNHRPLGCHVDYQRFIASHQGTADLAVSRAKRLSLWDVLIVEAIDLNVWIFTLATWWASTIMVYDNDFVWGWSQDEENNGNTGDTRIFRYVQATRMIIALLPMFLYCSWQLILWLF
jgi:hypothetical protein